MLNLSANNFIVYHSNYTLEDLEITEQRKLNELQKILLKQNRKTIKNAIIRIGTMLCYPNNKA